MTLLWEIEPSALTVAASGNVESITLATMTLTTNTPGDGPSLAVVGGIPVLRMDASFALLQSPATTQVPETGSFAVMVRYPDGFLASGNGYWEGMWWNNADSSSWWQYRYTWIDPTGYQPQARMRTANGAFSLVNLAVPDSDWHVTVVTWTPTGMSVYVDGTLVGSSTVAPGSFAGLTGVLTLDSENGEPTMAPDLAYVAMYDATVDPVALSASIAAAHTATPALTATGTMTWTTTGTVSPPPTVPALPVATPGGSVTPPTPPVPQLPPSTVPDPVIRRVSELMPAPTLDARGFPVDWSPTSVVDVEYARLQVVVEGADITYWDGAPIPMPTWTRTEPFGSADATVALPQITPFHALPAWCVPGANIDIRLSLVAGGVVSRFAGVVDTFGHRADAGVFTLECNGIVFLDDLQLRQPAFLTQPRDIGDVVADVLTSAVSRRHAPVDSVVTGCLTSVLGGWEPRVTGYAQQLLATAVTGGRQWTVRCDERSPVIVQKDTTTIGWTVSNGARGVTIDLLQDWSQAPNCLFGEGVGSDGGRWRNAMYPNWRPDDTPAYPNTNPAQTMKVGTTDAGTDSGSGVSDWQRKVGLPATGRFTQTERARALAVQTAGGISRDGIVGPQTWAVTFGTGSNVGTLECFYMPLAYSPLVMPRLLGPDGADLGANPAYDPNVMRVEDKLDFGQGVDKTEGTRAAGEILAREIHPGWTGTIGLTLDPEECSKFEVQEGSNARIRYFRGTTLDVHVSRVDYGETVTATVDTNARDYPTLAAIRDRERNATDPAKSKVRRLNTGSLTEARATFDAESPAGHVPRHALFANLWTVIRIPAGSYGSIVRTELTTSGAARPFSVAVFDRPITAATLLGIVGNPLIATANPWSDQADQLADAGMLMSWGWAKQPAGYYPGEYADPNGETSAPITGRLVDDASWDYSSTQAPWLWVAEIAAGSCYIEGRFWPGVS